MWSAFMNGSGLHGGGGAGGGYVPSQGWEFVPCSRMERADRGRGKSRSPLRRISSPPTVFSQTYEPQFSAPVGVGGEGGGGGGGGGGSSEGGAGSQLEILRGQMWSGPEAQQPQTQHSRLKKKFEDLKKRHVQDKEDWLREKESLLREVADIQGGENRRILLDLKTVLEEVQVEVKKEEEKRSELQLLYTRDRCAWDLEKAELKCRIAQLEARDVTGLVSGGVQAAGSPRSQQGETPSHRREREEQRRILADTQSAAMDLRCRLEHNERDWLREKAELLERFDVERREWESQLQDMQKKIEELYCEVKTKRGGTRLDNRRQDDDDIAHRLSIRSTSTGSSLLSDISHSEPLSSSSLSETNTHPHLQGFNHKANISGNDGATRGGHNNVTCFQADNLIEFNSGAHFPQSEQSQPGCVDELRSRGPWQKDSVIDSKERVDTTELDAMFNGAPGCRGSQDFTSKKSEKSVSVGSQESPVWSSLSYSSDKKKNTTALNAALKEIARVSEELCSYQDEIRKKSEDKRSRSESEKDQCDLNQIYDDFRALERENWINVTPDNTWQANRGATESWTTSIPDPDSSRIMQLSLGLHSEMDPPAPPIPPRTSSWNLSSPTNPDTELHIPDSPITTVRKCHSPCVLMDRKGSSPSIVRKFGAMLQENEGKVLIDGMIASCSVPANSNCNMGCCHNRWSCDPSKFTSSSLSTYGTVQKSFSEVNIRSASKDLHSDYSPCVGTLQIPPFVREMPIDLLLSSLETAAVSSNFQGSKRNIMLEKKTAEFNRTLFQAEMGRGVEEQDSFSALDTCSAGSQSGFETSHDVSPNRHMDMQPEQMLSLSMSNISIQNPELQPRRVGCPTEEVQIKQETQSVLPPAQFQAGLSEARTTSPLSPTQPCEIKHKVQTPSSPSRKTQNRSVTEATFCEPSHTNTQPSQSVDDSIFKKENLHGTKLQPAGAGVSLQQSSAENKQRLMTRQVSVPTYLSDTSKPSPRMMSEHPWKPLTLAAYPRPEGSRSNYGAVERILKNYENAAREQQIQKNERTSSPNVSVRQEVDATELDSLNMDPMHLPPTLRHTQTSHYSETHTTHAQLSSHSAMTMEEIQLIVQEEGDPPASPSSVQKNFSRPARPAKRRLPSRWASRSPTSSSPPSTPVVPPSFAHQKHADSFTYSHAFHIETVII